MKKILTAILLIYGTFLTGCLFNNGSGKEFSVNSSSLRGYILKAVGGDTAANLRLGNFADLKLPVNSDFNKLSIDSTLTSRGKKFYLVLLTYPNPFYNRFAVYDTVMKPYLIDKSLNGYVNDTVISFGSGKLISVTENFISKGILGLQRLSLYSVNDTSVSRVFKAFTGLSEPKMEFTQKITEISPDRITTGIKSTKRSPINGKADVFLYDNNLREYASSANLFDTFVKERIGIYKDNPDKPEITDRKSAYASAGIDTGLDTLKSAGNVKDGQGFNLTLTENWRTLRNIAVSDFMKKSVKGTLFLNNDIGASISVIKIPPQDSAEMYIKYSLTKETSGKYRVRFSDKIDMRKDFIRFFEYSCGNKKFLLILKASKFTYEKYKARYQEIINSFTMDCNV